MLTHEFSMTQANNGSKAAFIDPNRSLGNEDKQDQLSLSKLSVALRDYESGQRNHSSAHRKQSDVKLRLPPHPEAARASRELRSDPSMPNPNNHRPLISDEVRTNPNPSSSALWSKLSNDPRIYALRKRKEELADHRTALSASEPPPSLPCFTNEAHQSGNNNIEARSQTKSGCSATHRINLLTRKLSRSNNLFRNMSPSPYSEPQQFLGYSSNESDLILNTLENIENRLATIESTQATFVEELLSVDSQNSSNVNFLRDFERRLESLEQTEQAATPKRLDSLDSKVSNVRDELKALKDSMTYHLQQKSQANIDDPPLTRGNNLLTESIVKAVQSSVEQMMQSERELLPGLCEEIRNFNESLNEEKRSRMALEAKTMRELNRMSQLLSGGRLASQGIELSVVDTEDELRRILQDACTRLESLRCHQ